MSKLLNLMKNLPEGIDCAIIQSKINIRYFLNFVSSSGILIVTRDKSYFIIDSRYIENAKKDIKNCEIILQKDLYSQIIEILNKHNVKEVHLEIYNTTVADYEKMKRMFFGVNIETSNTFNDYINHLRSIKSEDEISCIKNAQSIAEKGYRHILNYICVGMSEKEVAVELEIFLKREGGEGLSFPIICSFGENAASPHSVPGNRKLKPGELCILDFGTIYNGYMSDMTRTFGIGNIDEEKQKVYNIVLESQNLAIKKIKKGEKCCEIDMVARSYISEKGYADYFGHGLGHSIGLEVHESPSLSKLNNTVLENNMIVTVEPGIYIPGKFGIRIEDMVVAKEDGYENITNIDKNLIIL